MTGGGLRAVPTRRGGRDRIYVTRQDGQTVAWYDRDEARVNLLHRERADDVLDVLAPFLSGEVAVGPPPVPGTAELAGLTLHPDDDLAPNRPGEALRVALERAPAPASPMARRLRPDPRRQELAAQEAVGAVLEELEGAGWRALHSVPLPGGDRVHHLLIGPGGVLLLHALPAHRQRVRIAAPLVGVGRGAPRPVLRTLASLADRVAHTLTAQVRAHLVLVGASSVRVTAPPRDARVLPLEEVPGLGRLGGELKPADTEAVYALARDRRTWV
ncbi:NERD domain-containing protein [Streptomyces sp. NPDC050560]|uniref:NERD domain-containing protein n=1 Tax=Streptomyces sp. NPDC050560 TaxID=3365630 RepID=UPI0037A2D2F6